MPDDHHPPMPRRNPEDIDLGAIKADLEFLIERTERLRKEQALNLFQPRARRRSASHRALPLIR